MSKKSTVVLTALCGFGVVVPAIFFLRTPTDPHYGSFPRLMAVALGLLFVVPACAWACFANFRTRVGKALLGSLVLTLGMFVYLNFGKGGFGEKVLSFPILAFGLSISVVLTVVLIVRGWRS